MPRETLPIEVLPAWSRLNNISFSNTTIAITKERGFGLISSTELVTSGDGNQNDDPPLITIPSGLVLSHEAVEEYAKEDRDFRQLLDTAGHQSTRGDILLFLLVHFAHASTARSGSSAVGVSNPWTEYIKFLPSRVPVPTQWTQTERALLAGTSLEPAVTAKLVALEAEFELVREKSSDIPCWNSKLWENDTVGLRDWILLDAWYRSRSLELPRSGESMVPCLDMVNHSDSPTAYYEESAGEGVTLLPRPGVTVSSGDEITISYGDKKPAAEMLFSYGFLDPDTVNRILALPLETLPDDPLAKAKLFIFGDQPKVHVSTSDDGDTDWQSPFAYLMCVNEEDGLDFRLLQDVEGDRQLRLFWLDQDVTDRASEFETLIQNHQYYAVLKLRVVTVIQDCLSTHLQKMQSVNSLDQSVVDALDVGVGCVRAAASLRDIESDILQKAVGKLEAENLAGNRDHEAYTRLQKTVLAHDETVRAYLESTEASGC